MLAACGIRAVAGDVGGASGMGGAQGGGTCTESAGSLCRHWRRGGSLWSAWAEPTAWTQRGTRSIWQGAGRSPPSAGQETARERCKTAGTTFRHHPGGGWEQAHHSRNGEDASGGCHAPTSVA